MIDDQGRPVDEGKIGEVVVTPLGIEGTPLLRYRTGDLAELHRRPCACGRQTPRLGPILGRREQMLKCRGTTLFPSTIAGVLHGLTAVEGHYLEVYRQHDLADQVKVVVGCREEALTATAISDLIAAATRVRLEVEIRPPEEVMSRILRSDRRKPVTFFDYRSSMREEE